MGGYRWSTDRSPEEAASDAFLGAQLIPEEPASDGMCVPQSMRILENLPHDEATGGLAGEERAPLLDEDVKGSEGRVHVAIHARSRGPYS